MTEASHYSLAGKRVWVAGHTGMVGSALVRRLASESCGEILTVDRRRCDLTRQIDVENWMANARPDAIFLAAAKVGGVHANDTRPAEFLFDNLMIEANVIHTAWRMNVEKLCFLGSSCIYPRLAPQPIQEGALLTGPLEPTNEWYAIAKIAGIKLCEAYRKQHGANFISAMPTNLYGPGDNFDLSSSHVIPALIRKVHEAKITQSPHVEIWGTGSPVREFLHVDDCADAIVFLMKAYSEAGHVNVGSGEGITIEDLAREVMGVVGYEGALQKDPSKPDGTPRKVMSTEVLKKMGWAPRIGLRDGLAASYHHWLQYGGSNDRRDSMAAQVSL